MEIDESIKLRIVYVASYIGTSTSNWLIIKRHLINAFSSKDRKLFSVRHPCTKKQIVNDFDKSVMDFWQGITGIELFIDPEKIHDPNWIHKPKGWKLRQINHERQQSKKNNRRNH